MVLGIPAYYWLKLESLYREAIVRVQFENAFDEDLEIVKNIPYNEMAKNNWVPQTRKPAERVFNCRKFFEVVRLTLLDENLIPNIAYRCVGNKSSKDYTLLAWAQKARLEARNISTSPINLQRLKKYIPDIRPMTIQSPEVFCPTLCDMLSVCGVALVFLPHIKGSFIHGATFYDGNKIVLGITVRGKDADKFWFSFFHEIAHMLYGHINQPHIINDEDEVAANIFARNSLIPDEEFYKFVNKVHFDKESILAFSKKINIDPGIVVGRLQKEQYIPYNRFVELKTKYEIAN